MIYTVTLNPALDYVLSVPEAGDEPPAGGRGGDPAGGKGVNVSLMLRRLEVPSVPTGLCAGVTGRCLLDRLTEAGLEPDFVLLNPDAAPDAGTRINVKLREARPGGVPALREINTAGHRSRRRRWRRLPHGLPGACARTICWYWRGASRRDWAAALTYSFCRACLRVPRGACVSRRTRRVPVWRRSCPCARG